MEKVGLPKVAYIVFLFCIATVIASPAQTFNSLLSFDGTDGANPYFLSLIQGIDGNLYGTTWLGGNLNCNAPSGCGTIFRITTEGALKTLYRFDDGADGANPFAGLVLATNGNFYGTTSSGTTGGGTVFRITAGGKLTTLHSFVGPPTEGDLPQAGLVQAADGNLYGTTYQGGANQAACNSNQTLDVACGTVFKITLGGKLTTLYSFCTQSGCADGVWPTGSLVQGTDGNLYGTTFVGGSEACGYGCGTVFKITPAGKFTTLHSFNGSDGEGPIGGLVQGSDGNFYGTTANGCGTVFKITPQGVLTTLQNCLTEYLVAGLVQGTDGNFYGTTAQGGGSRNCTYGCGTMYEITSGGTLTTLHSYDGANGSRPYGGLVQSTNGAFYGTTNLGGASSDGVVFSLSLGMGPFVQMLPTEGKVGVKVIILGNNLTDATAVSFNATAATFTAKTTEITTKVPAGATTGTVTVTTASGGTLSSNVPFRVTPQLKSFKPAKGRVGTQVQITGVSLTQTTGVSFSGVAATEFTVNSDTEVTATVPPGAKTGAITITTLGGTATNTKIFTVTE